MRFVDILAGLFLATAMISAEPIVGVTAIVYFSPNGGCTETIVAALDEAKQTVRVQAYSFTAPPIAKALAAAKDEGGHARAGASADP